MKTEELVERLDALSESLNGVLGRLVLYRSIPEVGEAHRKLVEAFYRMEDLIGELRGGIER